VFQDEAFRTQHCLGSVNSVNALRLLVQVVHFFYAYFQITADHPPLEQPLTQPLPEVSFSIPTGAAGHVTAGLIAKLMGLPIDKLVMAVNANDVLHTMMTDGVLVKGADVHHTASPAMDIQVSLTTIISTYSVGATSAAFCIVHGVDLCAQ
jgi:threonine synthase